jgi:hypothetical protein
MKERECHKSLGKERFCAIPTNQKKRRTPKNQSRERRMKVKALEEEENIIGSLAK